MIFIIIAAIISIILGIVRYCNEEKNFSICLSYTFALLLALELIAILITFFISGVLAEYNNYSYQHIKTQPLAPMANEYYLMVNGERTKTYQVLVNIDEKEFNTETLLDSQFSLIINDEEEPTISYYDTHFKYPWLKWIAAFNLRGKYYLITIPSNSIYFSLEVLNE